MRRVVRLTTMKKAICVAALAIASAAMAPASEARTVAFAKADEFRQAVQQASDQGADAITTMPKRRAHAAKLDDLIKRAEQLFGGPLDSDFGSCVKSVMAMRDAWTDQMILATRIGEPREIAWLARQQFEAGIEYWACRMAVDALDTRPRPTARIIDASTPAPTAPFKSQPRPGPWAK